MTNSAAQPTAPRLTLAEFLAMPETKPASEFIDGEIIQKPMPKGKHSRLQGSLTTAINQASEGDRIALAFPELRCTFGTRAIVPDVAVFTWGRIPFTADDDVPDDFELAPDWTIEILSPDQSPIRVIDNILYALRGGSRLGWLISPEDRSVMTFLPGQQSEILKGDVPLPILADVPMELTVNGLFSWLSFSPQRG